ncbi:MAG: hypothetical protein RLZZ143_3802 [Cyanobacteriota bacterium]
MRKSLACCQKLFSSALTVSIFERLVNLIAAYSKSPSQRSITSISPNALESSANSTRNWAIYSGVTLVDSISIGCSYLQTMLIV